MMIVNPYIHTPTGGSTLPEKADLETMDFGFHGRPFIQTPAKTAVSLDGLDYSFQGRPFWGNE